MFRTICFASFLLCSVGVCAQAPGQRPISEQQWQQATADLDYSKDVPRPPKPKKDTGTPLRAPSPTFDTSALANLAQILAILLAVAAIVYGVYRALQQPHNRRIARDGAEITEENLETYLHETDLERFLREALDRGDYPQAVRVYFLMVIKHLSETGDILWSKEKTNRDYLREMRGHPQFEDFQQATRTFERIWYGNAPLNAASFSLTVQPFQAILNGSAYGTTRIA